MPRFNLIDSFGDPKADRLIPLFPNVDGRLHGFITVMGIEVADEDGTLLNACLQTETWACLTDGRETTEFRRV